MALVAACWGAFRSLDKSRPIKPAPALATASNGLPVSASRVGARSTWEDTAFVLLPPGKAAYPIDRPPQNDIYLAVGTCLCRQRAVSRSTHRAARALIS